MTPRSLLLWILAVLLMGGSVVYQRLTGPTHPRRGRVEVAGQTLRYRLIRTQETTQAARVHLPAPEGVSGRLLCRRYPTQDPWSSVPMVREGGNLAASLPLQPAAAKIEYRLQLDTPQGSLALPAEGPVVLRYKDPVPTPLLLAHVLLMFLGVLVGLRTGLAALAEPGSLSPLTTLTLALLTVGGLILGPFVQKYAFGAYWTGWPWGTDLTDNKTILMWLAWAAAFAALRSWKGHPLRLRLTVGLAALLMATVYLIPHSLRGSQLDYGRPPVQGR